jgi:hypothetical protein
MKSCFYVVKDVSNWSVETFQAANYQNVEVDESFEIETFGWSIVIEWNVQKLMNVECRVDDGVDLCGTCEVVD